MTGSTRPAQHDLLAVDRCATRGRVRCGDRSHRLRRVPGSCRRSWAVQTFRVGRCQIATLLSPARAVACGEKACWTISHTPGRVGSWFRRQNNLFNGRRRERRRGTILRGLGVKHGLTRVQCDATVRVLSSFRLHFWYCGLTDCQRRRCLSDLLRAGRPHIACATGGAAARTRCQQANVMDGTALGTMPRQIKQAASSKQFG